MKTYCYKDVFAAPTLSPSARNRRFDATPAFSSSGSTRRRINVSNVNPETNEQEARPQLQVDDSQVVATYANFCRVTGTPEELIVDFGLNPQPMGVPSSPIPVNQRIVVNFYTAKRLYHALGMTLQRHEAAFGNLEVNVNKRLRRQ
ncbi:MAG: DUF3467 domain-containing protein [Thermoguttaceae bacterium]|nr:DUF3467 domain-containing protein [Thermoguttaceae bacterium]